MQSSPKGEEQTGNDTTGLLEGEHKIENASHDAAAVNTTHEHYKQR